KNKNNNLKFQLNNLQALYNNLDGGYNGGLHNHNLQDFMTQFVQVNEHLEQIKLPKVAPEPLSISENDLNKMASIMKGGDDTLTITENELNDMKKYLNDEACDQILINIRNKIRGGLKYIREQGGVTDDVLRSTFDSLVLIIDDLKNEKIKTTNELESRIQDC